MRLKKLSKRDAIKLVNRAEEKVENYKRVFELCQQQCRMLIDQREQLFAEIKSLRRIE